MAKVRIAFKTETLTYVPVFANMKQLINVVANLVLTMTGSTKYINSCYDEGGCNSCNDEAALNSCYNKGGCNTCYDEAGRIGILLRILRTGQHSLLNSLLDRVVWPNEHRESLQGSIAGHNSDLWGLMGVTVGSWM